MKTGQFRTGKRFFFLMSPNSTCLGRMVSSTAGGGPTRNPSIDVEALLFGDAFHLPAGDNFILLNEL